MYSFSGTNKTRLIFSKRLKCPIPHNQLDQVRHQRSNIGKSSFRIQHTHSDSFPDMGNN